MIDDWMTEARKTANQWMTEARETAKQCWQEAGRESEIGNNLTIVENIARQLVVLMAENAKRRQAEEYWHQRARLAEDLMKP